NKVSPLDGFAVQTSSGLSLHFKDLGVEGGLWPAARYHYELRHYKRNRAIDSGSLAGNAAIPISADVLSSMDDFVGGTGPGDESRFFYYKLKIERDGKKSKEVRVYLYRGETDADTLKIVRIEREG
ncbi:MAG: hypothetical protein O7E52_10960, partial [Candidatus Poribacteria bacterium]|nr:hypothetical protein [Candidatus Poribacteria bacterium]